MYLINLHRIDKDVRRCDRQYWYFTLENLEKLRNIMCRYRAFHPAKYRVNSQIINKKNPTSLSLQLRVATFGHGLRPRHVRSAGSPAGDSG